MDRPIHLELPYPPSVNHYWRHVGARILISAAGHKYREHVRAIVRTAGIGKPRANDMAVTLRVHPPDRRRRDLDNILKALFDAMQHGGVYEDDSQIKELHAIMTPRDDTYPGKVLVEICPA